MSHNEQPLTATIQPGQTFKVDFTKAYPKLNIWRLLDPYLPLLEIKRRAEVHHKPTRLGRLVAGSQSLVVGPISFMASEGQVIYRRRLTIIVYAGGLRPGPNFVCEACGKQKLVSSGMLVVDAGPAQFDSMRYMLCSWCNEHGALDDIKKNGWWLRLS